MTTAPVQDEGYVTSAIVNVLAEAGADFVVRIAGGEHRRPVLGRAGVPHGASLRGRVGPTSAPSLYTTAPYLPRPARAVDDDLLRAAAAALRGAARPVIIAGNGVRVGQATANLSALARAVDAPVAT